jgi:hypothetical protein
MNVLSTVGAMMVGVSMLPFLWNLFISLRKPKENEADPWDGYTLEWYTTSPPPPYNFDTLPPVRSERPLFDLKYGHLPEALTERRHQRAEQDRYEAFDPNLVEPGELPPQALSPDDAAASAPSPTERPASDSPEASEPKTRGRKKPDA